eukprot:235785-Prymnesium_polylepis.1
MHYAIFKAQPAALKLFLGAALLGSPVARHRGLALPLGNPSDPSDPSAPTPPLLQLIITTFPRTLAACIAKREFEPYYVPPDVRRAPAALLDCAGGTLAVQGSASPGIASDFWANALHAAADGNEIDVQLRLVGVPGLTDGSKLFELIVHADLPDLITSPSMQAAIAFKWKKYGERRWHQQILIFFLFLASYSTSLWMMLSHALDPAWLWPGMLSIATALAINAYYGLSELRELRAQGAKKYLADPLNLTDVALVLLVVLVSFLLVARALAAAGVALAGALVRPTRMLHGGPEDEIEEFDAEPLTLVHVLAAASMMLVWPKAVGVARGSERLSFLNDVIVTTVLDMPAFMLIMAFIMALFGFSFALLTRFKTAEFGTILRIAFTVWNLQLGDYEQDLYLTNNSMTSFFFGYTFLVNIVCLNVLIALMGD